MSSKSDTQEYRGMACDQGLESQLLGRARQKAVSTSKLKASRKKAENSAPWGHCSGVGCVCGAPERGGVRSCLFVYQVRSSRLPLPLFLEPAKQGLGSRENGFGFWPPLFPGCSLWAGGAHPLSHWVPLPVNLAFKYLSC